MLNWRIQGLRPSQSAESAGLGRLVGAGRQRGLGAGRRDPGQFEVADQEDDADRERDRGAQERPPPHRLFAAFREEDEGEREDGGGEGRHGHPHQVEFGHYSHLHQPAAQARGLVRVPSLALRAG
jgi:hypothetical protein